MIRSLVPTHVQNLVTILQWVSLPSMRQIARQEMVTRLLLCVLPTPTAEAPEMIFTTKYVKRRGSAQGHAFSGFENKKKYNI